MMVTKYLQLIGLLTFCSCGTRYAAVTVESLVSGTQNAEFVEVEGTIYSIGTNLISLHGDPNDLREDYSCVALIVSDDDRDRAVGARGQRVKVRGGAIPIERMTALYPSHAGLINGRLWRGTQCDGAFAVFVEDLRIPTEQR